MHGWGVVGWCLWEGRGRRGDWEMGRGWGGGDVRVLVDEAGGVVDFVMHDEVEVLSRLEFFVSARFQSVCHC